MKVILVIDDSDAAAAAIETVERRPWPPATSVLVLAVVPRHFLPPPPPSMLSLIFGGWHGPLDEASHARAQVALVVESLRSYGIDAKGEVRLGHARREISRAAREWAADLIVLGAAATSRLQRLLPVRNLATALTGMASCPVDVIRASENPAPA